MEETTELYQSYWCSATSPFLIRLIRCAHTTSGLRHREDKAQLIDGNGLDQMDIETRFLRHRVVLRLAPASQCNQQHRRAVGQRAQRSRGGKTVHRRHAQIQDHYIRRELPRDIERLRYARRLRYLMAQTRQQIGQTAQGVVVVIGYENTLGPDCPLICPTLRASTFQHRRSSRSSACAACAARARQYKNAGDPAS